MEIDFDTAEIRHLLSHHAEWFQYRIQQRPLNKKTQYGGFHE